jgi:hypothetical protein
VKEGPEGRVNRERWNVLAIAGAVAATVAFIWWPLMGLIAPYPPPPQGSLPRIDGTPMYNYYSGFALMALVFALVASVILVVALVSARRRGISLFATIGGVLVLVVLVGAIKDL